MIFKLNPSWPSDRISLEGVIIKRDTILKDPKYQKWTKSIFEGKPPLLIEIKESQQLDMWDNEKVDTSTLPPVEEVKKEEEEDKNQLSFSILEPRIDNTREHVKNNFDDLTMLDYVGPVIARRLRSSGYKTYESIANVESATVLAIQIRKNEEIVEKIIESAKQLIGK